MDDWVGIEMNGGVVGYDGPPLQFDMSARERKKYAEMLHTAARMFTIAGDELSNGNDEHVAKVASIINMFLVSAYTELQEIVIEAVEKNWGMEEKVEREVEKAVKNMPDSVPEEWGAD